MGEFFTFVFINPITNILVALYKVLSIAGVPYALGFAIILLTVVIKLALWPFVSAQIKTTTKMQKINPHMKALQEKHKGDKQKLNEEMMKLYKEHGVNPAAGCLPLLIQMPILISLYNVLNHVGGVNSMAAIDKLNSQLYFNFLHINKIWDTTLFSLKLGSTPQALMSASPAIILVPVITGILQFILSKMMMPEEVMYAEEKLAKATKTKQDDFQVAFQKQSLFIFPAMIAYFSFISPIGLTLYWNTFSLFGILQQYLLVGPGGAKPWFDKVKKYKK